MNREEFFRNILPYADAMLQSQVDVEVQAGGSRHCCVWNGGAYNLGIIGPTEEEVHAWMPMTASTAADCGGWWSGPPLDEEGNIVSHQPQPAVFSVGDGDDLNKLLEGFWHWRWCDAWSSAIVLLAPPPEVCFAKQFRWPDLDDLYNELMNLRGEIGGFGLLTGDFDRNEALKASWDRLRQAVTTKTSAALALTPFIGWANHVWVALPDDELAHGASAKLRVWAIQEQLRQAQKFDEYLHDGPKDSLTIEASRESDKWAEARLACWRSHPAPFVPDSVWAFDTDGADGTTNPTALALAGNRESGGGLGETFYYRRRLTGRSRQVATTVDGWRQMFEIALGNAPRTEDDRFVVADHILGPEKGQYWSACGDDPADQPMWTYAKKLGYPVRTVAEVCTSILHLRDVQESDFSDGQILIPLRGRWAGNVYGPDKPCIFQANNASDGVACPHSWYQLL